MPKFQNFSKNADLLDYEILDFDTLNLNETGINDNRMRLPDRYDISKFYKRNKRNNEKGRWVKKDADDLIDISSDFDCQITNKFPDTIINNNVAGHKYGGNSVTLRRLYLILCEKLNGGIFFIDTYFESVYPYTVKSIVDASLESIKAELLEVANAELEEAVATKKGSLDIRYKSNRGMKAKIKRYEQFASAWEDSQGEYLANIIKEDIVSCLESGQIPLLFSNDIRTERIKKRLGLSLDTRFFATGQLIESLQLFVKIRGNNTWKTDKGLLV